MNNQKLNPIKLGKFLEHYHIDEWRQTGDKWQPWGDCGMCNGAMESKGKPLTPPTPDSKPILIDGVWYWSN